ncbi:MAG: hypothetical protein IT370_00845 [Deltaproteobacteria bacterium]|nr:hypothetical protein [Deltaproteobacteria bacterium]
MNTQEKLDETWARLRSLSSDVEKRVRGAQKDALETWHRLEPRLRDLEKKVTHASSHLAADVGQAMAKLSKNLQELSERIDGKRGPIEPEAPEAAPPKGPPNSVAH